MEIAMIGEYKDFLAKEECQDFIDIFYANQDKLFKDSCGNDGISYEIEEGKFKLEERTTALLNQYLKPFNMSGKLTFKNARVALLEDTSTPPHFDKGTVTMNNKLVSRPVTFLVYLNTDFVGGDFLFPAQQSIIKPEEGKALLFPANMFYPHATLHTQGKRFMLGLEYHGD
jgi:hypothetical protein